MKECCQKWLSNDVVRISGEYRGYIEHLFRYCPECGNKLKKEKLYGKDKKE